MYNYIILIQTFYYLSMNKQECMSCKSFDKHKEHFELPPSSSIIRAFYALQERGERDIVTVILLNTTIWAMPTTCYNLYSFYTLADLHTMIAAHMLAIVISKDSLVFSMLLLMLFLLLLINDVGLVNV